MAKSLYVSGAEPFSGKVLVSLGLVNALERTISRIGFFRPVARPYQLVGTDRKVADRDLHLMHEVFLLDLDMAEMYGVTDQEAEELLSNGREPELHERIFEFNFSGRQRPAAGRSDTTTGKLGFGLWWVKTLMTRFGGSIAVQSDGRRGTTFTLRLPVRSDL